MGANTKIEWADHTFNPWRGCTKVSAGCAHCYAETQSKRNPGTLGVWGPNGTRVVAAESYWRLPAKWDREAAKCRCNWGTDNPGPGTCDLCMGIRPRVFCGSLMDAFEDWCGQMRNHKGEPLINCPQCGWEVFYGNECIDGCRSDPLTMADVRRRLFATIDATPNLDWLLVTKRPENIRRFWPTEDDGAGGKLAAMIFGAVTETGYEPAKGRLVRRRDNVWLLTSVEDQAAANARIPHLLACRDLTPVLGLSVEPLLGPVDLKLWTREKLASGVGMDQAKLMDHRRMNPAWVIVGAESCPHRRPCQEQWVRSIVEQCRAAGVACFVKQLDIDGKVCKDIEQFPEDLRVREFPEATPCK